MYPLVELSLCKWKSKVEVVWPSIACRNHSHRSVAGEPTPEVRWFRGDRKEPIAIPRARTFVEHGLHTLIVPEATESEKGMYFCRAINAYGQVDMSATVDVISSSAIDGGKPAVFVSRPMRKSIDVTVGEDVSVSFRVNGVPKPRGKSNAIF